MRDSVRIGYHAAFWGDSDQGVQQLVELPDLDYLASDYLAEVTMALLARRRDSEPGTGFVPDGVKAIGSVLEAVAQRGIRVVTNAGGLDPGAAAKVLRDLVHDRGLSLKVISVHGDDLLAHRADHFGPDTRDTFTGEVLPDHPSTLNAYLGARPIAQALGAGADIVVTGRCVDSAVVLGPLIYEFGWDATDFDRLSAGSLVGHILECGPQCAGGLHTDWWTVPGWDNMGYPYADVSSDGSAIISKPEGTGGLVTVATVAEQILYEISDPGSYLLPDVVADWRNVALEQVGPDRVRVTGARGQEPTARYKVTATVSDRFRVTATSMFAGMEAAGRARRTGGAIVTRAERLNAAAGRTAFDEISVEVVGSGELHGRMGDERADEVVLKVGLMHRDRAALELFSKEFASMSLVAQGMTGFFAGRPRVAPVYRVLHLTVSKAEVPVTLSDGVSTDSVASGITGRDRDTSTALLPDVTPQRPRDVVVVTVPLRRIAYARSGDKGNSVNIGIVARDTGFYQLIKDQVTAGRVEEFFKHYSPLSIQRWELPGFAAINLLLEGVLGGSGGTSTLRYDSQGKSYAAMLLSMPVAVEAERLSDIEMAATTAHAREEVDDDVPSSPALEASSLDPAGVS
jgi:hypothetical protein